MPTSLKRFELAFLISLAIGALAAAVTPLPPGVDAGFAVAIQAGTLLLILGMVLMISRRRSRVFRALLVVLIAIGLVLTVPTILASLALDAPTLLLVVQTALQTYGIVYLFQPDARAAFRKEKPAPTVTA